MGAVRMQIMSGRHHGFRMSILTAGDIYERKRKGEHSGDPDEETRRVESPANGKQVRDPYNFGEELNLR